MKKEIQIICPKCNVLGKTERENFFDLYQKPEMIEDFATNNYFKARCGNCKQELLVLDRTEVINIDKKYYIVFDSDPSYMMDKIDNTDFKNQVYGYTIRFTNNPDDFAEKIMILETNIKDTALEIVKSYITFSKLSHENKKIVDIKFVGLDENKEACFMIKEEGSESIQVYKFKIYPFLNKILKFTPNVFTNKIVVNMQQAFRYVIDNIELRKIFGLNVE